MGEKKRHRRVEQLSEVDARLIAKGLKPSWQEQIAADDIVREPGENDRGDGANDRRLQENVPPHAQPRA